MPAILLCQQILLLPENAAPASTAMPMFLTSCETERTYGNMAESELLRVIVVALLGKNMQAF